jgi:hypothetical protein
MVVLVGVLAVVAGCAGAQSTVTQSAVTQSTGPTSLHGEIMRIEYERSGGFAGITRSAVLTSDDMSRDELETGTRLVEEAGFFDLPEQIGGEVAPDGYSYRVTVVTATESHTVEAHEPALPAELIPLLDWLDSVTSQSPGK